ncbi:MAG: sn-glycerol-1-phosphate dehydrogenase [Oscillospiraceae bacterium]|jgi:glycerol-1-phosphate dehydrogenase [NAD(P)+]|nr:sn-glycerol-1-phosphate dehydrogenase [Oscillospiraceae bacterium]
MSEKSLLASLEHCPCGRDHDRAQPLLDFAPGAMTRLPETLRRAGLPDRLRVVADGNGLAACPELLDILRAGGFSWEMTRFDDVRGAKIEDARRVLTESKKNAALLAVGTGSLHDLCRYAAFETKKPLALLATAPSMDGFASTVAPIFRDGFKDTLPGASPRCVVAPPEVLSAAPLALRAAGFGDIVGKVTALFDWHVARLAAGEYHCPRVEALTRDAYAKTTALAQGVRAGTPEAMAALMEALTLSGLCIQASGLSRPASGGEHHMAHYWEIRATNEGDTPPFHGLCVGAATPVLIEHYKRFAAGPCPEIRIPSFSAEQLRDHYGRLYPHVRRENTPDPLRGIDPARLRTGWPDIQTLAAALPDPAQLRALLRAAGAPDTPQALGLPDGWVEDALRYACYIRSRLTLLRLTQQQETTNS